MENQQLQLDLVAQMMTSLAENTPEGIVCMRANSRNSGVLQIVKLTEMMNYPFTQDPWSNLTLTTTRASPPNAISRLSKILSMTI